VSICGGEEEYYKEKGSLVKLSSTFKRELNELLNMVTERDEKLMHRLAVLLVLSPGNVLKTLVTRIFDGHLRISIVQKVILNTLQAL